MQRSLSKIFSIMIVISFISSMFYYELSMPELEESSLKKDKEIFLQDSIYENHAIKSGYKSKPPGVLSSSLIEGNYVLRGYFTHDEFVDLDDDGNVYALERHADMNSRAPFTISTIFIMNESKSHTWPDQVDTYCPLIKETSPYTNSSMFSPTFSEATNIQGKIHVLSHIYTNYIDSIDFTIRVKVSILNPTTGNITEIASHEELLPDGMSMTNQKVFELTLNNTYTIPSGNRLKLSFEGKVSDLNAQAEVHLSSSYRASGQYDWIINDGVYSQTYSFGAYDRILGMQVYYKSTTFPEIEIVGITNSTFYYEEKDIQITVSGATASSFRWNLDSYTPFVNTANTTLPTSEGWHYLEIRANDEYNNTAIEVYDVGYDSTESYLILSNPLNNTIIDSPSLLNFTTFGANEVTCEWDNNDTFIDLLSLPGNNLPLNLEEGYHDLNVFVNDTFVYEQYYYVFGVDPNPPLISLVNVLNDTIQPSGKLIEVNITDFSSNLDISYKWDDNIFLPWLPSDGTVYITYLPETEGYHNLTINAEDDFFHFNSCHYRFNISSEALLVELRTMNNESWYYGGDTVELTVSGTNNTLLFKWDEGIFTDGNPFLIGGQILTLDGIYALPTDLASYHYLTIKVGSTDNTEYTFVFEFRIDRENPVIDSSILNLDEERFKNSDVFTFILSDNATSDTELTTIISIDGNTNITLEYPFLLDLIIFSDGLHNFSLYVSDIAGNSAYQFISFYIDSTAPTINIISFEGLVTLPDTTMYVPYGSTVQISVEDDDPIILMTYSWDSSEYQSFTDTIILNYDGYGVLIINASDSIWNEQILTYQLTVDSCPPNVTLAFPFEFSSINDETSLFFNTEDISLETISFIEFSWDIVPAYSPEVHPDSNGDFIINLLPFYATGEEAILSIYTEDIVGNNKTYLFTFEVDMTPPDSTLYIYDDELGQYVDASTYDYIRGGTNLWYNNTSSPDLAIFIYHWDAEDSVILDDSWTIQAPTQDGYHNLTIILRDSTGEGTSPNEVELTLFFTIDDISIKILEPTNLLDEIHSLVYKESFVFTIQVYDTLDNLSVLNLNWHETALNNDLYLEIINTTIDPKTFEFTVNAINVGSTSLIFEFSSDYSNNHTIVVNLLIDKKEGSFTLLDSSERSCIYEDNISIEVNLKDELLIDLEIISISVNGTVVNFNLLGDYIYQFEFSSKLTEQKGFYALQIIVESGFYFGCTNDSFSFIVEIEPIPLVLFIEVSDLEIVQGSTVVVTGTLTFLNGTPVTGYDLTFYIYIYYKSGQGTVDAVIEGYDDYVLLTDTTRSDGEASIDYLLTDNIDYIAISVSFEGSEILEEITLEYQEIIKTIKAGLSPVLLYSIIGASIILLVLVSFIVYKSTKRKPFEKYLEKVPSHDLIMRLNEICPGVILSIFDQKVGPTPILSEHSFDYDYGGRFAVGTENFLLKIADQAYSSLGFEDIHHERKISSMNLPNEGLMGFVHAIQLENKKARGGVENLSVIMIVQADYGTLLLANSEYIYHEIDDLISKLKSKEPKSEIEKQISIIRQRTTQVVLAAIEETK